MTELKPCPFCGGEAEIDAFRIYGKPAYYGVRCRQCRGGIPTYYNTEAHAAERWNRRAEPKRGNWLNTDPIIRTYGMPRARCGRCGGLALYELINVGSFKVQLSNFCPNCGADMRGGGNETH